MYVVESRLSIVIVSLYAMVYPGNNDLGASPGRYKFQRIVFRVCYARRLSGLKVRTPQQVGRLII